MNGLHERKITSYFTIFLNSIDFIQMNTDINVIHCLFCFYIGLVCSNHLDYGNNWAVIVSTSRYWFNYRHTSNALTIYNIVKKLGVSDDKIILLIADHTFNNPRNIFRGTVYNTAEKNENLYKTDIEVDYGKKSVNVENFIRIITGCVKKILYLIV